ncbi:MAG: hypothetical protein IPP17_03410 [Bacteroidetes bacterium]|nr:hypothetical protein [Bacteroidota bacterium]
MEIGSRGPACTLERKGKKYLGLDVKHDAEGRLQDIHWSHGSIGYFRPIRWKLLCRTTHGYRRKSVFPACNPILKRNSEMKTWLNQEIHAHGKQYDSETLCTLATGKPLDVSHFTRYAKGKFGEVYGVRIE